jgi:hypothetical protein
MGVRILSDRADDRPLAVTLARALDMNDTQWKREEIDHATWSDTYVALWTYAATHGVSDELLQLVSK